MNRMPVTPLDAASLCLGARARALEWLVGRLGEDGGPAGELPLSAQRVPLALAYCGRSDLAIRTLAWYLQRPISDLIDWQERYASYQFALLIQGAASLSRYDAVRRLRPELVALLAPCGAPWSRGVRECNEVEAVPACQAAITFLAIGDVEAAVRIGHFLLGVWRQQPTPDERLFMMTDGVGNLITQVSGSQDARDYVVERTAPLQHFFFGGIAAAALVQLAWATGEGQYLQVAQSFHDFATRQTRQFETYQVCKTAWGASYLYAATGSVPVLDWMCRTSQWFVETQRDDGSWSDPNYPMGLSGDIAVTAEFIQHLTVLAWGLSHETGRAAQL